MALNGRVIRKLQRMVAVTTEGRKYLKTDMAFMMLEDYLNDEGLEVLDRILELTDEISEHNRNLTEDDDF